jgi:transcriptional regulator with PAS, ATPase and Fis domain
LVEGGTIVIGRAQECDVHVIHPSVSRRHVAIHAGPPAWVEDLGSVNGTRIFGRTLAHNARESLPDGAVIEAGSAMIVVQSGLREDVRDRGSPAPLRPSDADGHARTATGMQRLERLCVLVAASELSVLLTGETGVGKEVFAERIHRGSPRASGPFMRLNTAALPETLLESELFGYERGAFTGAVQSKPGLFEVAMGGTVFLDEVGELPLATQAKLLRVLEAREVLRIGGLSPRPIDVRFVAATNRDLESLVARKEFRGDLYFRLNGITLNIPPLRERLDEVAPLARAFVAQAAARSKSHAPRISREALSTLESHMWPGNVRELRNTIERAVVLAAGATIDPEHLLLSGAADPTFAAPLVPAAPAASPPHDLRNDIEQYERQRVLDALQQAGGNQTHAAKALGISRRTLVARLTAYGLTRRRSPKP